MIHNFFLILAVFIVLPAESTIVRVYIRKISPLCPNQQRSVPIVHALIFKNSAHACFDDCLALNDLTRLFQPKCFLQMELVRLGGWPTFCYHVNGSPRFVRKCVILAFVWKLVSGKLNYPFESRENEGRESLILSCSNLVRFQTHRNRLLLPWWIERKREKIGKELASDISYRCWC